MYCINCGREIDEENLFCPFCGKELNINGKQSEISSNSDNLDDRKAGTTGIKKQIDKKKAIIIASVIFFVLISATIGILIMRNRNSDIDLAEYVPTEIISGFDGYGYVDDECPYVADSDKVDAYIANVKNEEKREDIKKLFDSIIYTTEEDSRRLSNGDKIEINAQYNEALAENIGINVINETITYEINNLEEGEDVAYQMTDFSDCESDFVLPDSDSRKYQQNELREIIAYDTDLLQDAINEIYARHGYIFDSIHTYDSCSWYMPVYTKDEFSESWFNAYENANIKALTEYRSFLKSDATKCMICGKKIYKSFNGNYFDDDMYYCDDCDIDDYFYE